MFYLRECQGMGIKVLPPDINESFENFTVSGKFYRFAWEPIKNVGLGAVKSIVILEKRKLYFLFNFPAVICDS